TDQNAKIFFSDHEKEKVENFGDQHFRPEIDRGVLRKILLDSLEPQTVVWDSHFITMERQGEGWLLHFKNAASVYADLVIGSDGANSKLRPYLTDIKPFYSGITMLEGNVYDGETILPNINALLRGGKIMAFGNEKNILMGQKADGEIGFYASFKTEESWVRDAGVDFSDRSAVLAWFKKYYVDWDPVWFELFENSATPFIPRPIYCMPLDQRWEAQANLTIIGDAAHLMPPFAGEGVNMAMLDALELSRALTADESTTLQDAIAGFENKMRESASGMAKESLDNGMKMHSENALQTMLDFFGGFEK
ncbi:MAG: FAD-dependent monooxygenase, partial [Pedobacter sp.]